VFALFADFSQIAHKKAMHYDETVIKRGPTRAWPQEEMASRAPAPLSILVAEDDPCDALLLEQAFFSAGVNVPIHFVDDGQEAIDYLLGKPPFDNRLEHPLPTLLVLNLKMSRLDGIDLLRWLCRQPDLSGVPTVVFASSWAPEDIEVAYASGADFYMVKPDDPAEFITVAEHLSQYWLDFNPRCSVMAASS